MMCCKLWESLVLFVIRGFCSSSLSAILVISLYVQSCDTSQILVMRLPANRLRRLFSRVTFMILLFSHVSMNHSNQSSARLEMDSGKESEDHSFSIKQPPPNVGTEFISWRQRVVLYGTGDFPFQYDNAQSVVRFSREQPKPAFIIRRSLQSDDPSSPIEEVNPEDEYVMEFARRCAEYPGRKPVLADIQNSLPPQQLSQLPMILVGLNRKQ